MDALPVIIACTVNVVALFVQAGALWVWKGQITERVDHHTRWLERHGHRLERLEKSVQGG